MDTDEDKDKMIREQLSESGNFNTGFKCNECFLNINMIQNYMKCV